MAIRGNNCTGESDPVLISLEKTLNSKKMLALTEKQKRNKQLDSLLKSITLQDHPTSALEHGYNRARAQDSVLYYLSGYVAKKALKFSSCTECQASVTNTECVPPAAILTEKRSFVPGALKHPSQALNELLTVVEAVVQEETKTGKVFGNLFWCIVDVVSKRKLVSLGCGLHTEEFTAQIIKFYLVMRMHFYSRFLAERNHVSEQVKAARKKSRLL